MRPMASPKISARQREILTFIESQMRDRGYPPSVFAMLAALLERAGPGARGSITGLYTVLVEGDDHNEPIADAARCATCR